MVTREHCAGEGDSAGVAVMNDSSWACMGWAGDWGSTIEDLRDLRGKLVSMSSCSSDKRGRCLGKEDVELRVVIFGEACNTEPLDFSASALGMLEAWRVAA